MTTVYGIYLDPLMLQVCARQAQFAVTEAWSVFGDAAPTNQRLEWAALVRLLQPISEALNRTALMRYLAEQVGWWCRES